ncbi:MAG: 4Fe-4S dicluster domain-containing protein, partial [Syntrophales bacterium LBB04]|nr:4Fe-4S dicluster domain-containing protein [Syntrophales bacterium LBB04]
MPPAILIEPDLQFVKQVRAHGGDTLKKCFQCATCSVVCGLSPDGRPFPRKEMVWAQWGLKERLLRDPDVWLCHQCNDCSTYCPRGARPGDVMKAIQRESVVHYALPRFLGRWANEPKYLPLLLFIPVLLLGLALLLRAPIENAL